ncbi:cell division cycle 7-related protein kinase-like isoform X2 [Leguminivora glycinivorella]|uniref:cell division cycle 7-related protein kinase-like isoform X2 n=1 Tax=Leguminivora glycinivorella TaxID=1035111 RepID=UPI00200C8CA6|nr:cell division cycle 7-related protein kinase-like isoform X2 [Leguminivora glycinivorella]
MSRIRGIEAKVKKEILHSAKNKNGPDTACDKDDVEKDQVKELLAKIPKLAKTFDIHRKIGEGTFSSVYLGSLRQDTGVQGAEKRCFAVKHLVPTTHPTRVAHELRCLRDIGGKNHVIGVELCLRNLDHVVFIMPYIPHQKFSEYVGDMDAIELRQYMRALLTALRHVHTFGVIHRDVKPSNFLYDRERRRYALVDFGLAQHTAAPPQPPPAHQPLKRIRDDDCVLPSAKRMALDLSRGARSPLETTPVVVPAPPRGCACAGAGGVCGECAVWAPPRANRAGTQGFRPPEVFFKYPHQSTAVDMWACGVMLASVLSGRYPFFRATDDLTALAEITELLGTEALQRTAGALGCRLVTSSVRHGLCLRKLSAHLRGAAPPHDAHDKCVKCTLRRCVCREDTPAHIVDPSRSVCGFPDSAFALAARLLEPDPRARITAADALRHPFLDPPPVVDTCSPTNSIRRT